MEREEERDLNELIREVRKRGLVDTARRRGRNVEFTAASERFTLNEDQACAFMAALLRIATVYPVPQSSTSGESSDE